MKKSKNKNETHYDTFEDIYDRIIALQRRVEILERANKIHTWEAIC